MIKLGVQALPKESADRLSAWLNKPEFELLKDCLITKIHQATADSINQSLKKPAHRLIDLPLPDGAVKAMSEAGKWKVVLDALLEISQPSYEFTSITSTTYSHARHD